MKLSIASLGAMALIVFTQQVHAAALREVTSLPAQTSCILKQATTLCGGDLKLVDRSGINYLTARGVCYTDLRVKMTNRSVRLLKLIKNKSSFTSVAEADSGMGFSAAQLIRAAQLETSSELSLYDVCN